MHRWLVSLLAVCAPLLAQDAEDPAFSVSGQVVTSAGRPCEGAHVQLWDALAADRPLARAVADKDGQFELTVTRSAIARREHPFGPVRIEASKVGRARVGGRIAPGTSKLRIVLPKPAKWSGVLRNAAGDPLPGAPVEARQGDLRFATTTDEQGAYAFIDMGAGRMDLGLKEATHHITWIQLSAEGHVAKRFAAAAGELVDEKLVARPVKQGRIVDAGTKQPLAGVRVLALRVATPVETVSDEDGKFAIEVEFRYAEVVVQHPDYAVSRYTLNVDTTDVLDLPLARAEPVGGSVMNEEGTPIPFADVRLDAGFGPAITGRCDESGMFGFKFGVAAFGQLTAGRRGYLPGHATVDATWRADRVRVELVRGREVTGTVTHADSGVMGAEVVFRRRMPPGIWKDVGRAYTNARGEYRARAVPAGATHAFARLADARSALVTIDDQLDFAVQSALPLSGRVIDDEGSPLEGVAVHPVDLADATVKTDSDGQFRSTPARIGQWGLQLRIPDGYVGAAAYSIIAGEPTEIVVQRKRGLAALTIACAARRAAFTKVVLRSGKMVRRRWLPAVSDKVAFGNLGAGTYVVEIDAFGYIPFRAEIDVAQDGAVEFTANLERAGTLILAATPGARLVVQTLEGRPSPVISRRLKNARVVIRGFGPGRYRLIARGKGENIVIREVAVGAQDAPRELDLVGGPASTLEVTVKNADGSPLKGASIELVTAGGFTFRTSERTDAEGKVTISRLIGGPLRIVARSGEDRVDKGIQIEPDSEHVITLEFR